MDPDNAGPRPPRPRPIVRAPTTWPATSTAMRIDRFHQTRRAIQNFRPYNTGQGIIGQDPMEKRRVEETIRQFADQVADSAQLFLLREQAITSTS